MNLTSLLKEYSEKLILQMINIYKSQTQDSEDQVKSNIKRFEQLTNSIAKKLADKNPLIVSAIPDDLKANNKFRDITLYKDYNSLLKVLKAADSKPVDIYKQAIEMYKKQDQYANPQVLGNYVARFKQNLNDLIKKIEDKDEDTLRLIPKQLLDKEAYKNILNWRKFHDLEVMLDGVFPIATEEGGDLDNDASTNADLIYKNEKDGIEVYKGDEEHKCVQYGKGYSWCIGRSMYANYRYLQANADLNRMFYFIFDRTQPKTNKWHVCVIHVNAKGLYTRTSATNDGDDPSGGTTWEKLGEFFEGPAAQLLWNKIKGLKNIIKFIPPNKGEQRRIGFRGQRKTLEQFIDMDSEDKLDWLRANATNSKIVTSEIVKALPPDGEISRNELINYNRVMNFDELKDSKQLLRRYAEYRFSRYPDDTLPVAFLPYFKDESKKRYYDKYKNTVLTVEFVEQFFDESYVKDFIEKDANRLWYIPLDYVERIQDPKLKTLYKTYSKLYQNWAYDANTNKMSVADMAYTMPKQSITPVPMLYSQWKDLDLTERKTIMALAKKSKFVNDNDNGVVLYYSSPFIVDDYVLVPSEEANDGEYQKWVLSDINGNIVKKIDGEDSTIGDNQLISGFPTTEQRRVYTLKELVVDGKPVKLNETIYDDWTKFAFMRKAGIIK